MPAIINICINTIKEMIRDKIIYLLVIFFIITTCSSFVMKSLVIVVVEKIIMDFSLAAFSFYGSLLAIFLGTSLVYREIDKKTIYTVLSKPVSRVQFLLGKFFGLMVILLSYSILSGVMTLLVAYKVDMSNFIGVVQCVYLNFVEFIVIMALSLLLSTIATPLVGLFSVISMFLIGHLVSSFHPFIEKIKTEGLKDLLNALTHIFDLNVFNIRNEVVYQTVLELDNLFYRSLYGLILIMVFFIISIACFRKKEF